MIIPFTLNGKKIVLDADPTEKLLDALRRQKLFSVKEGCTHGCCSSCTVLLNGKPVPSCIMPLVLAKDADITTLEYFVLTEEYQDIAAGFEKAGIQLCGYCNPGKIFTAWDIMQTYQRPTFKELCSAVSHMTYCCTDRDTYVNGILYAIKARKIRLGATNVRK